MGSDGLGTQAEERSQDPRLRRQDGLVMLPDPAVALLWNHDHEIFVYLHRYRVLSLVAFSSALAFVFPIPFTTPEVLTSHPHTFSWIYASSISISPSRGFPVWWSIIPVLFSSCSPYTMLLVFEPCMILPCISSLGLFLPLIFRSVDEKSLQCLFSRKFVFMGCSLGSFALVFCFP